MRESDLNSCHDRATESPPLGSVWTTDRILQKPPQAPHRRLQRHNIPRFHDARNDEEEEFNHTIPYSSEEDSIRNQDEVDHGDGTSFKVNAPADDEADDDDDKMDMMVQLHRIILPSRKLFDDDEYDDEDIFDNSENSTDDHHQESLWQVRNHLQLPTLQHNDIDHNNYSNNQTNNHNDIPRTSIVEVGGQQGRICAVNGNDYHQQQQLQHRCYPFGNNPLPFCQRFESVVVDEMLDDDISIDDDDDDDDDYDEPNRLFAENIGYRNEQIIFRRLGSMSEDEDVISKYM